MWTRISLKHRVYILLSALFLVTCSGSAVMAWYSHHMKREVLSLNPLAELERAQELELLLTRQEGFLVNYLLDQNPDWITQFHTCRNAFYAKLGEIKALTPENTREQPLVSHIADEYDPYAKEQDRILELYAQGQGTTQLHQNARTRFFDLINLCDQYKTIQGDRIRAAKQLAMNQMTRIQDTALAMIVTHILLLILLGYLLVCQILNPMRALVLETTRGNAARLTGNDVKALSLGVRNLIEDVGQIQVELKKSQENLLQAEKLAMVGKLAAGMAHSVRNPFTSVKMRLFSMSRSLTLTGMQKDDFDVISQEINHIDTIVQNFLEFSRPPKLKMQHVSPSTVVDTAIQLLRYRLESYAVKVVVHRENPLPAIEADPDQLKEVVVNLMVNACEAMPGGGEITIDETVESTNTGRHLEIRVSDTGTGIPSAAAEKVFDPFFTTKEEGTGLGLSIVARIVEEHGGSIRLRSPEGREGAVFLIVLPLADP